MKLGFLKINFWDSMENEVMSRQYNAGYHACSTSSIKCSHKIRLDSPIVTTLAAVV